MKKIIFAFAALCFSTPLLAETPGLVAVPVTSVFVPVGFDDNDEAQIILDGMLPNTCYRLAHTEVEPTEGGFIVRQLARRFGGMCIPSFVPFWTEVSLGRLTAGEYKIGVVEGPGDASLSVAPAPTSSQDDFLYAPVQDLVVERNADGLWVAQISGRIPSSCLNLKETRVLDQGHVLVVLPILEQADADCQTEDRPWAASVVLPQLSEEGQYLVHVRSMSGKAVNSVFTH
jgi:hypothetical protein